MTKSAKDRDRARAMDKSTEDADAEAEADADEANMDDEEDTPTEAAGSKVIVIHVGSQNLRIGLSSDALPKTMPMVIARKSSSNESEDREEPKPKRLKRDDGTDEDPERVFGLEVSSICLLQKRLEHRSSVNSGPLNTPRCLRISRSE